ncbi:MAG TPA: ferritin-like domain-containing protein [Mucilaginibacter sp.]
MDTKTAVKDSKLKEFFVDQLKDIYWAEKKLIKTLPKLREAAAIQQLRDAFGAHHIETEKHVERIERVFEMVGEKRDTTKCAAMAGIADEGEDIIHKTEEGTAQRDVGLIFAGQKAEHYEIATYGGLMSLAVTLGYNDAAELLRQTLEEEKATDTKLTNIAKNHVNYQAAREHA